MNKTEFKRRSVRALRAIIRQSGLSVSGVSERSGVEYHTLAQYTGMNEPRSAPSFYTVWSVCRALNVPIDWMVIEQRDNRSEEELK